MLFRRFLPWARARFSRPTRWFFGFVLLATPISFALQSWIATRQHEVRGLPAPVRAIHVVPLPPAAFNARADDARRAVLGDSLLRCQRLALRDLRLISTLEPTLTLVSEAWVDRLAGYADIPAFYPVGSDTIFTIAARHPSVRHEWVHALDDQRSRRMRRAHEAPTTDERVALRAVIEGTAMAAIQAAPRGLRFAGDLDHDAWVLAYGLGPGFVQLRVGRDLNAALQLTPHTTAEVLFGESSSRQSVAVPLHAPTPGTRSLCTDQLGALGVLSAMLAAGAAPADAKAAAHAWTADRLDLVVGPQGRHVIWTVAFGDSSSAATWQATAGTHLPLTAPRTVLLTVVSSAARRPSPLDALGK